MKYNELDSSSTKNRKRVGRGIAAGQGKTAGRGTKGQKSRTGKKIRATFSGGQNGIATATPKNRGFKSKRTPAQVVYLDHLGIFKGKTADNMSLYKAGLIATPFHSVKVIARGELHEKIILKVQAASASVIEAITKAGGSFEKVAAPIKASAKDAEKADK